MNPWEQLLTVQAIDSRIAKLDHRSSQLPERARLAELEDQLSQLRKQIVAAEADRHELVKGQRRIEDEITGIRDRIAREEDKLYSGGSSDPGMLQDLQDEIGALRRRIDGLEDDELELMVQAEPIDERLAALSQEQAVLDAEVIEATKALAEAEVEISRDRAAAVAERGEAIAEIDPAALERYEAIRDRFGGVAVARLEAGACGACHLKLSAVEHDRILHLPAHAEVTCEECGRFLVRS